MSTRVFALALVLPLVASAYAQQASVDPRDVPMTTHDVATKVCLAQHKPKSPDFYLCYALLTETPREREARQLREAIDRLAEETRRLRMTRPLPGGDCTLLGEPPLQTLDCL